MELNTSRSIPVDQELHVFCHSIMGKMEEAIDSLGKVQGVYRHAIETSSNFQKTASELNKSINTLDSPDLKIDEFEKNVELIEGKIDQLQSEVTIKKESRNTLKENLLKEKDRDTR